MHSQKNRRARRSSARRRTTPKPMRKPKAPVSRKMTGMPPLA